MVEHRHRDAGKREAVAGLDLPAEHGPLLCFDGSRCHTGLNRIRPGVQKRGAVEEHGGDRAIDWRSHGARIGWERRSGGGDHVHLA